MEKNSSFNWYYFFRRAEIFACLQHMGICRRNHEIIQACGGVCGSGVGGAGNSGEGFFWGGGGHEGMKLPMSGWNGSMKKQT